MIATLPVCFPLPTACTGVPIGDRAGKSSPLFLARIVENRARTPNDVLRSVPRYSNSGFFCR